jgi:hypothetical protein
MSCFKLQIPQHLHVGLRGGADERGVGQPQHLRKVRQHGESHKCPASFTVGCLWVRNSFKPVEQFY